MDYKGLKELLEGCITDKCEEFPAELDNLIADTARTGIVRLPWELLKPLFNYRLQKVMGAAFDELALEGEDKHLSQQLLDQLNKFDNPPFTIQRICELIVEPKKHYKKRDKYMRAMERCLLVVSTQEPDLTWMKSPRLTQLLEEPPKESLQEVVFDESMVNEFSSAPASGTPAVWTNLRQITRDSEQPSSPSESDQFNPAKPITPVQQDRGEEEASTSSTEEMMEDKSSTTNLMDERSDDTPESSSNSLEGGGVEDKPMEGVQQFPLSRKRSSSMRESLDSSEGSSCRSGGSDDDDRGTVLQEADSTTLGEQDDNGREEEEEEEDEGVGDLEQSTSKKMRTASPEVETESIKSGGIAVDTRGTEAGLKTCGEDGKMDGAKFGLKTGQNEEEASVAKLHSSSERETSTGQLERSHDSKNDSSNEEMETS